MSGTKSGGSGNGDERRIRPLLEPAFVTELERLSENARRSSIPAAGRRRAAPAEPGRRPLRGAKPNAEGKEPKDAIARPRKATTGARAGRPAKSTSLARLFQRLFRVRHGSLYLLIDATESMEMRSAETKRRKWDQARRIVAALGVASRSRYERVCIGALGQAGGHRAPRLMNSADETQPIFESLERLRPGGKGRFLTALADSIRRAPADSACVIFSDFMSPEWEQGFTLLAESRIRQITLVQILDPQDMGKKPTSALVLHDVDADTNRPLTIQPGIVAGFRETLERFCSDLAARCREAGIGYCLTHTDAPFEETLIETLSDGPAGDKA